MPFSLNQAPVSGPSLSVSRQQRNILDPSSLTSETSASLTLKGNISNTSTGWLRSSLLGSSLDRDSSRLNTHNVSWVWLIFIVASFVAPLRVFSSGPTRTWFSSAPIQFSPAPHPFTPSRQFCGQDAILSQHDDQKLHLCFWLRWR